jgi:hypothetical protein
MFLLYLIFDEKQRRGQVEDLVEDGIQRGQDHLAVVRTGVAPETDKGVEFFCGRHGGIKPRFLNREERKECKEK